MNAMTIDSHQNMFNLKEVGRRLWGWVKSFFHHKKSHSESLSSESDFLGTRKPKTRKPRVKHAMGFTKTLDHLDISHQRLRQSVELASNHRSTRKLLRKHGCLIPSSSFEYCEATHVTLRERMLWSAVIFVSMAGHIEEDAPKKEGAEPLMKPQFFYAVKIKKASWNCVGARGFKGLLYECGIMYSSKNRSFWLSFEAGIDPRTGDITVFKVHHQVSQLLPNGYVIRKKVCDYPWTSEDLEVTADEWHKGVVAFAFNIWNARDDMWKVSTRTADTRVIFLVPWSETKYYFKDRKVEVLTENGTKKRIIHHVKEHTRVRNGKETIVKEHIRGLRTFEWKGYQCAVTAPKFHTYDIDTFEGSSTKIVNNDPGKLKTIDGPAVMDAFADLEDQQNPALIENIIGSSAKQ